MAEEEPKESIFNTVAETYDEVRPDYPVELVNDLVRETGCNRIAQVLEIGAGTGKLTKALASNFQTMTGLELGNNLAEKAMENLAGFSNVKIVVGNFDTYQFPLESFDLVIAATSYHWLDPQNRSKRIGEILKSGGFAAIIETRHIDAGKDNFPSDSQQCYIKWDENTTEPYHLPTQEEVETAGFRFRDEFEGAFENTFSRTYASDVAYDAGQYMKLLSTYSDTLRMNEASRNGLLDCLGNLIESGFGGKITKSYLWQLLLLKKK